MIWIRHAKRADLPYINKIENAAILETTAIFDLDEKSIQEKEEWFDRLSGKYPILIAEWDGDVAGYACLSPYNEKVAYQSTAELSLYVSNDFQGKGIGHALMKSILEQAADGQFHSVVSLITEGNGRSESLHERYGFHYIGTLKEVGFKFDEWQNVKLYQWIGQD